MHGVCRKARFALAEPNREAGERSPLTAKPSSRSLSRSTSSSVSFRAKQWIVRNWSTSTFRRHQTCAAVMQTNPMLIPDLRPGGGSTRSLTGSTRLTRARPTSMARPERDPKSPRDVDREPSPEVCADGWPPNASDPAFLPSRFGNPSSRGSIGRLHRSPRNPRSPRYGSPAQSRFPEHGYSSSDCWATSVVPTIAEGSSRPRRTSQAIGSVLLSSRPIFPGIPLQSATLSRCTAARMTSPKRHATCGSKNARTLVQRPIFNSNV